MKAKHFIHLSLLVLALLVAANLQADTPQLPPPNSVTATAAINQAAITIRAARRKYEQAVRAARRVEKRKLKIALAHAMRRGNLKEALLVQKWIKQVEASLHHTQGLNRKEYHYRIYAAKDWQPIFMVKMGEVIHISARGLWTTSQWGSRGYFGASGETVRGKALGCLIGNVKGSHTVIFIKDRSHFTVRQTGLLTLGFMGRHKTARGYLDVTIYKESN